MGGKSLIRIFYLRRSRTNGEPIVKRSLLIRFSSERGTKSLEPHRKRTAGVGRREKAVKWGERRPRTLSRSYRMIRETEQNCAILRSQQGDVGAVADCVAERKIFELAICFIVSYRICLEFFLKRYEERTSPEKLSESEKNHQIPY